MAQPLQAREIRWREEGTDPVQVGPAQGGVEPEDAVGENVLGMAWTQFCPGLSHGAGAEIHEAFR
ncbi:hypothetical protein DKG34_08995 [Streptomyces sp. NWU49]|nr:hypothetical protein DKG34_08995 [Streptomyces sp. NWU49]